MFSAPFDRETVQPCCLTNCYSKRAGFKNTFLSARVGCNALLATSKPLMALISVSDYLRASWIHLA